MRLIITLILFAILSCTNNSSSGQIGQDYTSKLELTMNKIKRNETIVVEELKNTIPTTEKEYGEFYSYTYPDKSEFHDSYNKLVSQIEKLVGTDKSITISYLEMSNYVDGEFAESYFDVIDFLFKNNPTFLCGIRDSLAEDKIERLKSTFEQNCSN